MNKELKTKLSEVYGYVTEYKKMLFEPITKLAQMIIEQGKASEMCISISNFSSVEHIVNMEIDNGKLWIELENYEVSLDDLDFEELYWLHNSLVEFVVDNF